MLKKIIYTILIINIIILNINCTYADDENEEISEEDLVEVVNQTNDEPKINSRVAVVYDRNSRYDYLGKRGE